MNSDLLIIIYFFIIHWIGDFVLQTRKMGRYKSKNIYWLLTHVFIYALTFGFTTIFLFDVKSVALFMLWLFITHAVTDNYTSKASSKYYTEGKEKAFWTVIGFDQLLHAIQIIVGYILFLV